MHLLAGHPAKAAASASANNSDGSATLYKGKPAGSG